jgi:hypothetical protein
VAGDAVKLKTGQTLKSPINDRMVIVVRAPADEIEITCIGVPLYDPKREEPTLGTPDAADTGETQIGKRYADGDLGLELLCTKPGPGTVAANGVPLPSKAAKQLPASD